MDMAPLSQQRQSGQGTANASRFHAQQIQQRSTLHVARRTNVTRDLRTEPSEPGQPRYGSRILTPRGLSAMRTLRRIALCRLPYRIHPEL
jgi:hypothetical protein